MSAQDKALAVEENISELERLIRNAGPLALSHSSFLQAELYLANFEHLRDDLQLLINNYLDEPDILVHLMELWERMETALTAYLSKKADMVEHKVVPVPANAPQEEDIFDEDYLELDRLQRLEWMNANRTPESSRETEEGEEEAAQIKRPDPASRVECPICGDEYPGAETFILQCDHQYCTECLVGFFETVLDIRCPDPGCARDIERYEVRAVVSRPMFNKYEEFRYVATMNANPNARWCPSPDCNTCVVTGSEEMPHLTCPKCKTNFCFNCGARTCDEYKAEKGIKETKEEKDYKKWASKHTKKCPQCKAPIEKNDGCNHMTCIHCQFQFCWLCGGKYTDNHYDVYNIAGCPGMQFSEANTRLSRARRFGFRALIGTGIVIGAPVAIAVGIPALVIGGPIYGAVKWHRRKQRRSSANQYALDLEEPSPLDNPQALLQRLRPVQHRFVLLGPLGSGRTALAIALAYKAWNPDTAEFNFGDEEHPMDVDGEGGQHHGVLVDPLEDKSNEVDLNTTVHVWVVPGNEPGNFARRLREISNTTAATADAPKVIVFTKMDEANSRLPKVPEGFSVYEVSAKTGAGIERLRQALFVDSSTYMTS